VRLRRIETETFRALGSFQSVNQAFEKGRKAVMRNLGRGLIGRKVVAIAVALAAFASPVALGTAPAVAKPKAGTLDARFGNGGKQTVAFPAENVGAQAPKYELPFEFTAGHLEMAKAPGGKVVVAGATKVVQYLGNGKLDPSFGKRGIVTLPPPKGKIFVLAGLAVDSKGRILLAGLSRPRPMNGIPDPVVSDATLIRLTPTGTLDQSFANHGRLISNLGLGAPTAAGGFYPGDSVGFRDISVDQFDRPVLTGAYLSEIGDCRGAGTAHAFITRLTVGGALDVSFGDNGLRQIEGIATNGVLSADGTGFLTVGQSEPTCHGPGGAPTLLLDFDSNGNLDQRFGSFGFRTVAFRQAPALTIAPSGKILLLGRPEKHRFGGKGKNGRTKRIQTIFRLLPSGVADPGWGRVGKINYVLPDAGSFSALTADRKDRIVLAGLVKRRVSYSPRNHLRRSTFLVARTTPTGRYDRSFGRQGAVSTGFGGPSDSFATQVTIDGKGRILVGGGIVSPSLESGGGFALARYFGGN
jgi:uncharacterized delta-60 repeat protein